MKKYLLSVVFVWVTIATLSAATIKGRLIDNETKQIIDFATVSLFNKSSKTPMKTVTTDEKGAFSIPNVKNGSYTLRISFVGYKTLEFPVFVTSKTPIVDLKTLQLSTDAKSLKAVEVIGQKSQMRFEVDKKVFDVDQNISAAGGSASEALQNIPSVNVDNEGNISLRNNSNVEVWINGKPSGLTADNRAQILEQMPAGSIESIEVITNPSSKYSPEGSAGIINLVLKKDRKAGYYGSVSVGANTFGGVNGSGNINYNSSKVDAYANIGIRYMQFNNSSDTYRESWQGNDTTILNQKNKGDMDRIGVFLRGGATYHVTRKDDIGLSFMGMFGGGDSRTTLTSRDGLGALTRERWSDEDGTHNDWGVTLDYTHLFGKNHDLRLYANYFQMNWNETNDFTQNSLVKDVWLKSAQKQDENNSHQRWEFQADYSNQISDRFKIEAGYKGNINSRGDDVYTLEGPDMENLKPQEALNNDFTYKENIQALYGTFSGKIDNFSFQAGLRGEYMRYKTESRPWNAQAPDRTREYWHLYPSLFLSYSLPKGNELQVNYTSRVNRPRGRQINAFRNVTDSTSISYGNPNLNPEFAHAIELNYIKNWDAHTLSASLYYRKTNDVIQQVRYFEEPVMYSTYENVTKMQNAGLELVAKNRLFKYLNLTTTVNMYYQQLNDFDYTYVDNSGVASTMHYDGENNFTWNARIMANLILPKNFSAQVTGNYNAKQLIAQGERRPNYSLDAGIRKSFFSRKFSIALSGRDLLDSRGRKNISWGDNFYQESHSRWGGRSVNLTLTYMFGKNGNNKPKPGKRPDNNGMDYEGEMMDF